MIKKMNSGFLVSLKEPSEKQRFIEALHINACLWDLKLSIMFNHEQKTLRTMQYHNYIIFDLANQKVLLGGKSDLKPFGKHTGKYRAIGNGAISFDDFMTIWEYLKMSLIPNQEYVVQASNEVFNLLESSGYEVLHRPYFAMKDCTHYLYTIRPSSYVAVNAAKKGTENITQDEFEKAYKERSDER